MRPTNSLVPRDCQRSYASSETDSKIADMACQLWKEPQDCAYSHPYILDAPPEHITFSALDVVQDVPFRVG